jgi:hypothetical protein
MKTRMTKPSLTNVPHVVIPAAAKIREVRQAKSI